LIFCLRTYVAAHRESNYDSSRLLALYPLLARDMHARTNAFFPWKWPKFRPKLNFSQNFLYFCFSVILTTRTNERICWAKTSRIAVSSLVSHKINTYNVANSTMKVDRTLTNKTVFVFDLYRQVCVCFPFSYFSLDEQTIGRKTQSSTLIDVCVWIEWRVFIFFLSVCMYVCVMEDFDWSRITWVCVFSFFFLFYCMIFFSFYIKTTSWRNIRIFYHEINWTTWWNFKL